MKEYTRRRDDHRNGIIPRRSDVVEQKDSSTNPEAEAMNNTAKEPKDGSPRSLAAQVVAFGSRLRHLCFAHPPTSAKNDK